MNRIKVAVYGSLRKGHGNHGILEGSKLLGKQRLPNLEMFSLGGFPGIRKGESSILTEVYEVNGSTLEQLDTLEGFRHGSSDSFYDREDVDTDFGDALIYTLQGDRYQGLPIVESGDWSKHSAPTINFNSNT